MGRSILGPLSNPLFKRGIFLVPLIVVVGLLIGGYHLAQSYLAKDDPLALETGGAQRTKVLGAAVGDQQISFNVPVYIKRLVTAAALTVEGESVFGGRVVVNDLATFAEDVIIEGKLTLAQGISGENVDIDLGTGTIIASNLVYSVTEGSGIDVEGDQELVITNTDKGSDQKIFKKVKVGSETIEADSNSDQIELSAGTNMTLTRDGDKVTFSSSSGGGSSEDSGWEIPSDGFVALIDSTDSVGIGTSAPSNKLEITSGTSGQSGLTFTNLTSASTSTSGGGKVLSLDTNGKVILVNDITSGGTAEDLLPSTSTGGTLYFNGTTWASGTNLYNNGGAIGIGTTTLAGQLTVQSAAAGTRGLVVKGAASQTANLQEWRDSDNNVLAYINSAGVFGGGEAQLSGSLLLTGTITANTNETINGIDINAGAISDVTSLSVDFLTLDSSTLSSSGALSLTSSAGSDVNVTSAGDIIFDDSNIAATKLSDVYSSLPNGQTAIIDSINLIYNAATGGVDAGGLWESSDGGVYISTYTLDLVVGGPSLVSSRFGVDVSLNQILINAVGDVDPYFVFKADDNNTGRFGIGSNDTFIFTEADTTFRILNDKQVHITSELGSSSRTVPLLNITQANDNSGSSNPTSYFINVDNNDLTSNTHLVYIEQAGTGESLRLGGTSRIIGSDTGAMTIRTTTSGNLTVASAGELILDDSGVSNLQLSDTDNTLPNSNTGIVDAINDAYNAAIGNGGLGAWTVGSGTLYPTSATRDLIIGGTTLTAGIFGIDESAGDFYFGYDNTASPTLRFEASDGDAGELAFNTSDAFAFANANISAALDNTHGMTLTSSLTGGNRTTDVFAITQPFHATNTSTGHLLSLTNNEADSTASILFITGTADAPSIELYGNNRLIQSTEGYLELKTTVAGDILLTPASTYFLTTPAKTGIGNSSPTGMLHVNSWDGSNDAFTVNQTSAGNILTASSSGTTRLTLANNGNITGTGTLTGLTGLTSSGTVTFSGFTNNGGVMYTNGSGVLAQTAVGSDTECLQSNGGGAPTWGPCGGGSVDLTSGVSGVLPIANGGTNKNLMLSAGGIFYADGDSFEMLSAGSSGDCLKSGGAGSPTWAACGGGGSGRWDEIGDPTANTTIDLSEYTSTFDFDGDTETAWTMNANSLTTGKLVSLNSTSTALTTGGLMALDWSPGSSTTATGDLFRINLGANGNVGNLFNVLDNGSSLFSVSETQVRFGVPTNFGAAGDVAFAYDIILSNPTASYLKAYAPLYLEAGDSNSNFDATVRTWGTGDLIAEVGGNLQLVSADPAMVFNTTTGTDTDFWLGVNEDAGSDDDDSFQIGKGTVNGTTPFITVTSAGLVGIATTNPGTNTLQVQGDFEVTGACTGCSSDERLKKDIQVLEGSSLTKLLSLKGVTFNWSDEAKAKNFPELQMGVIAQDVEKVFPELVGSDARGYKYVRYDKLIAPTIEAIREQQTQIVLMGNNVTGLSSTLTTLQVQTQASGELSWQETTDARLDALEAATASAELKSTGIIPSISSWISGVWTFIADVTFKGKVRFEKAVAFVGRVTYEDKDVAGMTEFAKDEYEARIDFATPYEETPIVTLTAQNYDGDYQLKDVSETGFSIWLNPPATQSAIINWQAVAVKDATKTKAKSASPAPAAAVTPEPSPAATAEPSPTPSLEPSPSASGSATSPE